MADQAAYPGGESGSAAAAPGGFVGRSRELAQLRADIERAGLDTLAGRPVAGRSRVLLIAGRPGSGRSALAAELARELVRSGSAPDGVLHARLTDPLATAVPLERTLRRLLDDAGAGPPAPGAGPDDLTEALRTTLASHRGLLVLEDVDRPEHIADLLPDSRECLVLVTATGPLTGVPDVRPCTLGGLERWDAVRLLARGAGDVRITVDPYAAESLAEECAGQPAALELVAGWLAVYRDASVADCLWRLRDIPAPAPSAPGGAHPAVARAFRLARQTLPPAGARLLGLLSLVPAGEVDVPSASALVGCQDGAARAVLQDLVLRGMLRSGPAAAQVRPPGVTPPGELYTLPGVLAPFLGELLEETESPAGVLLARARMLERTVRRVQSCWAAAEPPGSAARDWAAQLPRPLRFADAAEASRWLHQRLPALSAAATAAATESAGELDTLAARLIAALVRALSRHRTPRAAAWEIYELYELLLTVVRRGGLHRETADALLTLGDFDADAGRPTDARRRYRAALDAARRGEDGEDTTAAVRALESVGESYRKQGDAERAADWYGRALVLCQTAGDLAGEARLHGLIGTVHTAARQWPSALREWRAAAAALRRLRELPGCARALDELARAQEQTGRAREALRTRRDALECARRSGDRQLQSQLRLQLADACERLGDPAAARAHRAAAQRAAGPRGPAGRRDVPPQGAASPRAAGTSGA